MSSSTPLCCENLARNDKSASSDTPVGVHRSVWARRREIQVGIASLLVGIFGSEAAFASVKCQCNNGTVTEDMSSDYDDDDLDDACNDACSDSGGGRLWSPDQDAADADDDDDVNVDVRPDRRPENAPRRR